MGVAASLTAQINGANQGIRNLNDAVSSMQTGEGALAAAQEMGQRMLMLATQGANSTLGINERTSIVDELKKLVLAIDAIGGRTTFAGNPLLSRGTTSPNLAVFYSMQISNTPSDRVALDSTAFQNIGGAVAVGAAANGTLTLTSAMPDNIVNKALFSVNLSTGALTAVTSGGKAVLVKEATTGGAAATGKAGLTYTLMDSDKAAVTALTITAGTIIAFGDGKAASLAASLTDAGLTADPAADPTVITTAWQTVQTRAAKYVKDITDQRGLMGAYQNQMEYTLSNLTELSSNLASARSRVIDTDYASETAALTRGQILQQAATAMLAQANQMPNIILTLLK
jgi:flagellin